MDQEKTTFTYPFGTYAYRRMPFGLCNAPATFQRCMTAIFHDMIEESVEVFMDDFSVFRSFFDHCLNNLDKMLQHCKDAHLVLNWEKCHSMVNEGIVLGHKVSEVGLEVDKAKIDIISKLPPPNNIKGIRSFLGHVVFYQRFIKDFLKIARPLTKLLEKDSPFEFNDECQNAFKILKEKLTSIHVIVSLNWSLLFKLMCDASDFAVEAILGQKEDRKCTENVTADHLSRIKNKETSDDNEVDDNFPGETLMEINTEDDPWFADFANYLASDIIPKGMTYQQKNIFFLDMKPYFWEEPYLFKVCSDATTTSGHSPPPEKFFGESSGQDQKQSPSPDLFDPSPQSPSRAALTIYNSTTAAATLHATATTSTPRLPPLPLSPSPPSPTSQTPPIKPPRPPLPSVPTHQSPQPTTTIAAHHPRHPHLRNPSTTIYTPPLPQKHHHHHHSLHHPPTGCVWYVRSNGAFGFRVLSTRVCLDLLLTAKGCVWCSNKPEKGVCFGGITPQGVCFGGQPPLGCVWLLVTAPGCVWLTPAGVFGLLSQHRVRLGSLTDLGCVWVSITD
nr:DNA-directed DNA polymerase [Tanacetum cinerariifolium]